MITGLHWMPSSWYDDLSKVWFDLTEEVSYQKLIKANIKLNGEYIFTKLTLIVNGFIKFH